MAIVFTNLGASQATANAPDVNSNTDASSYATSSWIPPTTGIVILFVANSRATDLGSAPTVSGNSITWLEVASIGIDSGAQAYRLTAFAASLTGSTEGITTVDFAGDTQTGGILEFVQAEGVNMSDGVLASVVQAPTNSGAGATGTLTYAAVGHANNRPIAAFHHEANEGTARNILWTEADDLRRATPVSALETQYDDNGFQDGSATWATSTNWLAIGLELKAENTFEESVSIAALRAIAEATQIDFSPTIGFQLTQGVDPSVIQQLNATVGLGKLLSVTVDGAIVGLVTKGFVVTLDFSTNPVTITSFRATNVEASDT